VVDSVVKGVLITFFGGVAKGWDVATV